MLTSASQLFGTAATAYGVIAALTGLSVGSTPLIVVDSVGLLCGGLTLAVTLSLRGSLVRPATWMSCNAIPVPEESDVAGPESHADC